LFAVLFEVVSAYGTVGLSLGYPNIDASFSAEFRVISKLVIIAMQIRGRHRGLPYALDKAILLPSEGLHHKEEDDHDRRRRASVYKMDGKAAALGRTSSSKEKTTPEGGNGTLKQRAAKNGWSRLMASVFHAGPNKGA